MQKTFTKSQNVDSGLALLLLLVLLKIVFEIRITDVFFLVTIIIIMLWPVLLYPFSYLWYNISHYLGIIVSTLFLAIVFFVIVTPIGIVRQILKKDSLQLLQFKKNKNSVFKERNYTFTSKDLTTTF